MSDYPEVIFDRFLRNAEGRDLDPYRKGKLDLHTLEEPMRVLLENIQTSMNEALRNEKRDVPEHVPHDPFHVDFINSEQPNAIAFQDGGYSFIGVTFGLIRRIWETSTALARSQQIRTLLGLDSSGAEEYVHRVHATFFRSQLFFVLVHEYTHHVHGHVFRTDRDSMLLDEYSSATTGNLEAQAFEVDADGYSTYHVLAHLIAAEGRDHALRLLGLESGYTEEIQDERLLTVFILSVSAFLYALPATQIDSATILKLTHPPQATRMNHVFRNAAGWSRQNRPRLMERIAWPLTQSLVEAAREAVQATGFSSDWNHQVRFMRSEEGSDYDRALAEMVQSHVQSLGI